MQLGDSAGTWAFLLECLKRSIASGLLGSHGHSHFDIEGIKRERELAARAQRGHDEQRRRSVDDLERDDGKEEQLRGLGSKEAGGR